MKNLYTVLFTFFAISIFAQNPVRVYLKDKGPNAEVDICNVALSEKSIAKKAKRGIVLDDKDIPVYANYLNEIVEKGGVVKAKSRWFNYVLIEGIETFDLLKFDFVLRVEETKKYSVDFAHVHSTETSSSGQQLNYGLARDQIEMVRGHILHDIGFQGQGMTIAVIDGGFAGTDTGVAFDSLRLNNRILGTKSFVGGIPTIYQDGNHGTRVLSILGGYIEGRLIGSAPMANYWLLKSEKESGETAAEMDNWMMAAEFADSVGVDIISSSLGYNEFQGGIGNYAYSEMDGNTTIVTKAADMAAEKGILVIVSAGNEGNSPWQHITAPADGDSVMAIGSVTNLQNISSFSSIGPSADGRIKPNVVAMGQSTANSRGNITTVGNGTSFSCPIVAGMAACLWQSNTTKTNMEIFQNIENSATIANFPNNNYGHGVPNFELALYNTISLSEAAKSSFISVYPNPVTDVLFLDLNIQESISKVKISLINSNGQILYSDFRNADGTQVKLNFPFKEGVYILRIEIDGQIYTQKIIK